MALQVCSLALYPLFCLKLGKKGATPNIPHSERSDSFEKHSYPSQKQVRGMGEEDRHWQIPEVEAAPGLTWRAISLETTFIWAQSSLYVILSTRTPISLSYELLVSGDRLCFTSVFCVGQIALDSVTCSRVIFWTTGRWQLKNEPLKTFRSESPLCLAY